MIYVYLYGFVFWQPFLTKVIDRFQSTPARGLALVAWIREIVTRHTAYELLCRTIAITQK